MSRRASAIGLGVAVLLTAGSAAAFSIKGPGRDPCHEWMTLGALHAIPRPYASDIDPQLADVLAGMAERAKEEGLPGGRVERAFVNDVVERFDVNAKSAAEEYVVASFVAGVLDPDTRGFDAIKLPEARETHLMNGEQARHTLRRAEDNGPQGDQPALDAAREVIQGELARAHAYWNRTETGRRTVRWTIPHYGEVEVQVFAPAYHLGAAMHAIQDSYAHTLRDADGKVVTVMNYAEPLHHADTYDEDTDGLGHSTRFDECSIETNAVDARRFAAAREASARFLRLAYTAMAEAELDGNEVDGLLDQLFAYRAGCDAGNEYCKSPDYPVALEELTEPYSLCACSSAGEVLPSPLAATAIGLILLWGLGGGGRRRGPPSGSGRA